MIARLPIALAVNLIAALIGWRVGVVTRNGACVGAAIGVAIFLPAGLPGWVVLFASFFLAASTSLVGLHRKRLLRIEEPGDGRRGAANAIANCLVGVVAAWLALVGDWRESATLAMVAALVTGSSDTVASEIGKAWGRHVFELPSLRQVMAGTPGGVSAEGTAAGLVAAFLLALVAVALGLLPGRFVWVVVVSAMFGSLIESVLAAKFEPAGRLDNNSLNLINTGVGASVAVLLARL